MSVITGSRVARLVSEQVLAKPNSELEELARKARVAVLNMTYDAGSGHPGGSFSMQDFLVSLYHNHLNMSPEQVDDPNRDVFILSKGHCAPGLYAILGELGYYDKKEFRRLRRLGGLLQGHVDRKIPGIEMSTGSLGMGLGYANGVAMAKRMDGNTGKAVVVLGDGELQEGNIWESAMTAPHYKLDNVWCIVDWNKVQIDGPCAEVKNVDSVADKFRAFNWHVIEADGHNFEAIEAAYAEAETVKGMPICIVFDTKKGGGVDFMEGKADFHGRALKPEEMVNAMKQLGENWEAS